MDKKGNIMDAPKAFQIIVVLGIAVAIIGYILTNFWAIADTMPFFSYPALSGIRGFMINFPTYFDWGSLFLYVGLLIISVIAARKTPSDSVFYIFSMIATPFVGLIIWVTGTVLEEVLKFSNNHSLILGIFYIAVVSIALYTGKDE